MLHFVKIFNKTKKNQHGFTLLEITIAMAIFVILIFAWNNFAIQSYRSTSFGQQQLEAIRQAQKGIDLMAKELRELGPAENGAYPLELAGDQEIIFYSDIDQDVYTERVRYWLDESNLKKGVTEPSGNPLTYNPLDEVASTISIYVRNDTDPIFSYYNGDHPYDTVNNPLPAPARLVETKLIHVYLKVNVDPKRAPSHFELETDIQLRNLKDNL